MAKNKRKGVLVTSILPEPQKQRCNLLPPMRMNNNEEEMLSAFRMRLITKKCRSGVPPCKLSTYNRNKAHPSYDSTTGLPEAYFIMYCDRCQSYSHTGRSTWFKLPSQPSLLLQEFLVNRIIFHIQRLGLKLISSWIVQVDPGQSTIMLGLKLQSQAPSGDWHEKTSRVQYIVLKQVCSNCSCLIDESQLSSVVQLRQYVSDHRCLRSLEKIVLRSSPQAGYDIQKIKYTEHGVDFFFTNDGDAMALSHFLTSHSQAPVRCDQMRKEIQSSDCSSNDVFTLSVITAVICPIFSHDLVYLPLMVLATLGLLHMGPFAICLNVGSTISLLDPLNMKHCVINEDDYWKNPFESLKSSKDLVEYIVCDVNIVSRVENYTFADVQVARNSDIGKNDITLLTRTHLGEVLKPGDHAFGYDFHGLNITGVDINNIKHMLPDVVLIRKKWSATQPPYRNMGEKKKSPEYEQFLQDLESNPEAVFNLSLNGGDGEKQNSELPSENLEKAGLELEDLLADLDLNDQENRDTR